MKYFSFLKVVLPTALILVLIISFQNCENVNMEAENQLSKMNVFCEVEGRQYPIGAQLPSLDNCNSFSCVSTDKGAQVVGTTMACDNQQVIGICMYNNTAYFIGDRFKSEDGCNTCTCEAVGSISCTEMACVKPVTCSHQGKQYLPGETFKIECNVCVCSDSGESLCTKMACIVPEK